MRFFQNWRFLEFLLIGASLALLPKAKDVKVPVILMTGAWGISVVDRTQISRRLEKWTNSESERLNERIEGLSKEIPVLAESPEIKKQVEHLKNQIEALPAAPEPLDLSNVEGAISSLNTRLSPFEELDPAQIQSDFSSLREEQEQLTQRFEELPATEGLLVGMERATVSVTNWAEQLVEHIRDIKPYRYKLIKGRGKSREELIKALERTERHLILVSPWLTISAINKEVMELLEEAIKERNVQIDIGWGYWGDISKGNPYYIKRERYRELAKPKDPDQEEWKYAAIDLLEDLEREHPDKFRLKLMGTHEKLIVRDDQFAVVGSHNFLASGTQQKIREIGLKTDDPNIIKKLAKQFEDATNWEI